MRRYRVGLLVLCVALVLGGCARPPAGVDGDLTNDWPAMAAAKVPVPESGKCYAALASDGWAEDLSPLPCAGPHMTETAFVGMFTGADADRSAPPATGSPARAGAFAECRKNVTEYLGGDFMLGRMNLGLVLPSSNAWTGGARWFRCDISRYNNLHDYTEVADGTGSARDGLRGARPLALTCATETDDGKGSVTDERVADCAQPHNAEFAGLFTAPDIPWPTDENERLNLASHGCEGVVASYLGLPGGRMTNPVLGWTSQQPSKDQWSLGNRTVRCYAVGFKGNSVNGMRFTGSVKGIGNKPPR
jgi:hypothetical protein